MKDDLPQKLDEKEIVKRYIKSIDKGLLKVMSKMGISTYQSYCGAQIFDAVGLQAEFVATYFTGTATRIEGVGLGEIAEEARTPPSRSPSATRRSIATCSMSAANMRSACAARNMPGPPRPSRTLQHAVRGNSYDSYRAFAKMVNEQSERLLTIRGLFRIKIRGGRRPRAGAARGSRTGQEHREALCDRRYVVRLDLARGAHHARHRHEPYRRQVEHRRRRRGGRPLQAAAERQFHALRDQASRLRPIRRHHGVSASTPT